MKRTADQSLSAPIIAFIIFFALISVAFLDNAAEQVSSITGFVGWTASSGNLQRTSGVMDSGPTPVGAVKETTDYNIANPASLQPTFSEPAFPKSLEPVVPKPGSSVSESMVFLDRNLNGISTVRSTDNLESAYYFYGSNPLWVGGTLPNLATSKTRSFIASDGDSLKFYDLTNEPFYGKFSLETRAKKTVKISNSYLENSYLAYNDRYIFVANTKFMVFDYNGKLLVWDDTIKNTMRGKTTGPIAFVGGVDSSTIAVPVTDDTGKRAVLVYKIKTRTKADAVKRTWNVASGSKINLNNWKELADDLGEYVAPGYLYAAPIKCDDDDKLGPLAWQKKDSVCHVITSRQDPRVRLNCQFGFGSELSGLIDNTANGFCNGVWLSYSKNYMDAEKKIKKVMISNGGVIVVTNSGPQYLSFDASVLGEDKTSSTKITDLAVSPILGAAISPMNVNWLAGDEDGYLWTKWKGGDIKKFSLGKGKIVQVALVGKIGAEKGFVLTETGYVISFDPANQKELWETKIPDKPVGMAINKDEIYVTAGSKLYIIGSSNPASFSFSGAYPKSGAEIGVDEDTNAWPKFALGGKVSYGTALESAELVIGTGSEFNCGTKTQKIGKPSADLKWECQPLRAGTFSWYLIATDSSGNQHKSSVQTLKVSTAKPEDTTAPTCTISPDAAKVLPDRMVEIKGECRDEPAFKSGIDKVEVQASKDGGAFSKVHEIDVGGENSQSISFSCGTACHKGAEGSIFNIRFVPKDKVGRSSTSAVSTVSIVDRTSPSVTKLEQSLEEVEPNKTITLKAYATDNVGVAKVIFVVDGVEFEGKSTDKKIWTLDYKVPKTKEGETLSWFADAYDKADNWGTLIDNVYPKKFKVKDITPPQIEISPETPPRDKVYKGETQRFYFGARDNVQLSKIELLINGQVAKGATINPVIAKGVLSYEPTDYSSITNLPATIKYKLRATDAAGLKAETPEGSFTLTQPCTLLDKQAPAITNEKMAGDPVAEQAITFTADLAEQAPNTAMDCSYLSDATLYTDISGGSAVSGWQYFGNLRTAKINFTLEIPKPSKKFPRMMSFGEKLASDLAETGGSGGPASGPGGISGGALSLTLGGGTFGGSGTLGGLSSSLTGYSSKYSGFPGQTVHWTIAAKDKSGNLAITQVGQFTIKDSEPPVIEKIEAPTKIRLGETAKIKVCAWDWNVNPTKVFFIIGGEKGSGQTKYLAKVGGEEDCVEFEEAVTGNIGDVVNWEISVEDPAGNKETGSGSWKINSLPPKFGNDTIYSGFAFPNQIVQLGKKITDDNGLKEATLFVDTGNGFETVQTMQLSGLSADAIFDYLVPAGSGGKIKWKLTAMDIDDNVADDDPELNVSDDKSPPTFSNQMQSKDSIESGEFVDLSVNLADNAGLKTAVLETDEAGKFVGVSTKQLDGALQANVSFKWANPLLGDKEVQWRVKATDVNGNSATSPTTKFQTKAPAISPLVEVQQSSAVQEEANEAECASTAKPDTMENLCISIGGGKSAKNVTSWVCDAQTKRWVAKTTQRDCIVVSKQGAQEQFPTTYILVLGLGAVVVGAIAFFLRKKA